MAFQFQVPQFIEIEDKIFGPLTIKQFIYLAGGAGITIILLTFLPKFLALLIALPFIALSVALSFYKPNSRPFVVQLESMLHYFLGKKLYIWKKVEKKKTEEEVMPKEWQPPQLHVPALSGGRLKDMTWNLDVKKQEENDKTSGI